MTQQEKCDIAIIGAGPGGYPAAIRASQLGLNVLIIEKDKPGGICLNWGCIPTKALLRAAEVYHLMHHCEIFGLKVEGKISFDIKKVVEYSRGVSKKLTQGVQGLLKKNKIKIIEGTAKIMPGKHIVVSKDNSEIAYVAAKSIIIATGAKPKTIAGFEPDQKLIWTYKEAMIPDFMPKSLIIVGSGAIGIEFASFYRTMGADITIIEAADRILLAEDHEIASFTHKSLEKQGIKIITSAKLKSCNKQNSSITVNVEIDNKEVKFTADRLIIAIGVTANTEGLGLEHTKVILDRGQIVTDSNLETADKGIFAIGDVTNAPWLAHKATHEGIIAVEYIAGKKPHTINRLNIPGCTYSRPSIASIGLTELKAKEAGHELKIGKFPFIGNGKAIAMNEAEGMIKVIIDAKTGELLGAHMVGAEVTEMIQGFAIAKQAELTEEDIMNTIFPHPTMSEMMHEAVLDAYKRAIHI